MRPFISFLFVLLLIVGGSSFTFAKETVLLDKGWLVEGRAMVPLRSTLETIGATVKWDGEKQQIVATKGLTVVAAKLNQQEVWIDNKFYDLDAPVMTIDGMTVAPIRLLERAFEVDVSWIADSNTAVISTAEKEVTIPMERYVEEVTLTISAAGDVTLGGDVEYGHHGSFNQEAEKSGYSHFVKNIKDIFSADDLTMVNLETTLTNATAKASKKFRFKGDPSYTDILKLGSIETVNLANNHTFDYLQKGYTDTVENLKKAEIGYFGNEHQYIEEINGIKVGALGYKGWSNTASLRKQIKSEIQALREKGVEIVIVNFHWGEERSYYPNATQTSLGRFTIDSGADLVLGHHPHVVQGIEEYKDKFIVYSLGNFMFGGNRNPSDKDTFVFQQTFHLKDGKLTNKKEINVIPFSISSVTHRNNYQPTPMDKTNAAKLKQKLVRISESISNSNWVLHESNQAVTYE